MLIHLQMFEACHPDTFESCKPSTVTLGSPDAGTTAVKPQAIGQRQGFRHSKPYLLPVIKRSRPHGKIKHKVKEAIVLERDIRLP